MGKKSGWIKAVKPWFVLTTEERLVVAGVLTILAIGLVARYLHLSGKTADTYPPPVSAQTSP